MAALIPPAKKVTGILKLAFILFVVAVSSNSCKVFDCAFNYKNCNISPIAPTRVPVVKRWLNRNYLFSPGQNSDSILQHYQQIFYDTIHKADPFVKIYITTIHCPCDPTLANIDVTLVEPSGPSIPNPPPSDPKQVAPSGEGYIAHDNLFFSAMPIHPRKDGYVIPPMSFSNIPLAQNPVDKRILAIIDTGLDTTEFASPFAPLLWSNPFMPTVYNVVPSSPGTAPSQEYLLYDDNHVKHGTSVTALALQEIKNTYPRILPIRAFDANSQGSIYTVSCGLGCAIQNNATYINASWGYRGKEDPVLKSYIRQTNARGIPVIAAAGNSPHPHDQPEVCSDSINSENLLDKKSPLFYPAGYSESMDNVISVTQLHTNKSKEAIPCFFQNYGAEYVSTGVFNELSCCFFSIPGNTNKPLEGSSFATPVVTGILMTKTASATLPTSMKSFVDLQSSHYQGNSYTRMNNYFIYPQRNQ